MNSAYPIYARQLFTIGDGRHFFFSVHVVSSSVMAAIRDGRHIFLGAWGLAS